MTPSKPTGAFGFTVFIANSSEVSKYFESMNLAMNPKVVRSFVENALGTAFAASQSDCPQLSGFLVSTGRAEMINDYSGQIIYDAPYALAQEKGFIGRNGRFQKGKHYLIPNANLAFKLMISEMSKFYNDVMTTGRMSVVPTVKIPASTGPGRGRGRPTGGPHKFTQQRITATGRKSSLFRGPSIIKTKVFRPGLGKAQKQAGRKVRIGGLR